MNLFRSALRRATVKMSLSMLRRAQNVAIRDVGVADPAREIAELPQTARQAGPGSVKDWTDAMKIKAPRKITSFIRRKLR